MPDRVITANRLADGAVVWRDAVGGWHADIHAAAASAEDAVVTGMLVAARAEEKAGIVVGPYEVVVEVDRSAARPAIGPTRLRERIRAFGPTTAAN